ncbi:MAG TPA: ATP-binding protein, partial [Polyangiaceae bacterium]|nr:ATP-binding protein [Polyangiaceae bacterium]
GRASTVVTSQLPAASWHAWIGDPTLADAILDRLVNNAYKVDLKGNSPERASPNPPPDLPPASVASLRSRCTIWVITMRRHR